MFVKTLTTLSIALALVAGIASLGATSASAQTIRSSQPALADHRDNVWVGNEFAGRDSDANVRLQLRRDFGSIGGE